MDFPPKFLTADEEWIEYDGSPVNWRVSIYALIFKDNNLLILKNKTEKLCDIPGGGVELNETLAEALQREAMEEAGASIIMGEFVHLKQDYFYHSGQKAFFKTIQLFYTANLRQELTEPTEKKTEWVKWVPLNKISEYALPVAVKESLTKLIKTSDY